MEEKQDPDWSPAATRRPSDTAGMSNTERRCILHTDKQATSQKRKRQEVLPFDEQRWATVVKAAENREKKPKFKNSRYYEIVRCLPQTPGKDDGYHSGCYQTFTAVSIDDKAAAAVPDADAAPTSAPYLRSEASVSEKPSTSGVFTSKCCMFCGFVKRRTKTGSFELPGKCETPTGNDSIRKAALTLNDSKILAKIGGDDLISKEAKYHHSCKNAYCLSGRRVEQKQGNEDHPGASTIDDIHSYVEQSIIISKRSELLTSVFARHVDMCSISGDTPFSTSFCLKRNLMTRFGDRIKCQIPHGKKSGAVLYNSEIADDAVRIAYDYASDNEQLVTKAALLLRKQLLLVQRKGLPENPTLADLQEGEASPPDILVKFFTVLYSGQDSAQNCSGQVMRRVRSSCDDALFIVRRGQVKPAKQVALGVAMKSVTGSKKVIQVLNRFGHCINYNAIEELETESAEQLRERQLASPDGTIVDQPMGVAFDNFDELTHTLSGSNTLHDTMGILYQNIPRPTEEKVLVEDTVTKEPKKIKGKKRSLDVQERSLQPYRRKPKMQVFDYTNTDVFHLPDISQQARNLDTVWMMSHTLGVEKLPMWVGFNALSYQDNLPKQEVRYLPNMRQPITSLDVIHETLITTQRCAKECGQKFGIVTYDLNAAKLAMQIQATERPKFDDVFIMLGTFHIEMAFFKALGKIISDSGGPAILTNSEVLAPGSLNGFLTGKHFNRCKRLHPILALALEILHFTSFLGEYDEKEALENIIIGTQNHGEALESREFITAAEAYAKYTEATRSGVHGATAQFWMMYIDYIQVYHNLERATRTNDISLFIYTLTPVIGLFFATNHVNYSRWLTKYQLDLMNIDGSHPGLRAILEEGAFTVRRTDHQFSRVPVDLTLEQTVNADAASRLTGITSATNSYCARLRWMVTKSTRASFISLVQEMAGLTVKNDVAAELRPARIDRDIKDLKQILKQIEESRNPFDKKIETEASLKCLFNITTAKATSLDIQESLLNIPNDGQERHQGFLQSCIDDPMRFEEKITKSKLKTFTDECAKNRRSGDKRVAELKGTRDLMGRLVVLASKKNLDLPFIFEYPLTPVPLTMCSNDGTMAKTDKSALMDVLEKKVKDGDAGPKDITACIIDGQFLLHTLPPDLPTNYGGLARTMLVKVIAMAKKQIHLVFDAYPQPSLKDTERDRRGADDRQFLITGPEQRRPNSMSDALKSRSFKTQLPHFLAREWQNQSYAQLLGSHQLYLDVPGQCYCFEVLDGTLQREEVPSLSNNHEEADTKICLHAKAADQAKLNGDIVIRASDTDIAVIMLYHCGHIDSPLWIDTGTSAKKNRRYISLTAIYQAVGPQICAALPGFHAFSGCDYTSSFVRKGKVRPYAMLEKNPNIQKAFHDLAIDKNISPSTKGYLQAFTAGIYGAKEKNKDTLNAYRYKVFEKGYGPKASSGNPLEKLKGVNASAIPPCESEVNMHLKRASFVARMWVSADSPEINQHPGESNGWEFKDGFYYPIWHEGSQLPDTLSPHVEAIDDDKQDEEEEKDMTVSSDDEDLSDDE